MNPEARRLSVAYKRKIKMYEMSFRFLERTGASYTRQNHWLQKIEKAEAVIRMIECGIYSEETKV